MNAFQFGQFVGEKMAAGPLPAEAPMSNPAQAASTKDFLNQPGRRLLNRVANEGRSVQRGTNLAAAAAPVVGGLAGRVFGGNFGRVAGEVGGTLFGQQLRHLGGEVAATTGARSAQQPIPYGLMDGRLTNRPSQDAVDMNEHLGDTATFLDAMASRKPGSALPVDAAPLPQAQSRAPQAMPPRGTGMSQLRNR